MKDEMRTTAHDYEWHPKYFAFVTGLFCGLYMITLSVNAKVIDILGLLLPAGALVFPLCCIITDVLTEVYGFNRARQAIWANLICTLLFGVVTQGAIVWKPAAFWQNQEAFQAVFASSWRLALAGAFAWVTGEFSNSLVVSRMKVAQNAKNMAGRFVLSTVVGQFFDSVTFLFIAFAGTMPWDQFFVLGVSGWVYKVAYEAVALPVSIPVTRWIKRIEGVEHFDRQKIWLFGKM